LVKLAPVHPGEILREDYLKPLGLSINVLARALDVPPNHVSGIVNEKRGISALKSLRLARYFNTSPRTPARLAAGLRVGSGSRQAAARIASEVPPRAS